MTTHGILAIVIMISVTVALRFIPFIVFNGNRETPKIITYLGKTLPSAIMGMLVVYCLKGVEFTKNASLEGWLPALVASVMVVLSYVWKKNTLLSIIVGTAIYMILLRII